jgi:hypothetical protein
MDFTDIVLPQHQKLILTPHIYPLAFSTMAGSSSNKPTTDKAALEHRHACMMTELAEIQANIELAAAEEEERKRLAEEEKEKQRELLWIQWERTEKTWKAKEAKAVKAAIKVSFL